ncbi:hypothetical protein ACCO45_010374 [Purpureocillium lilacinum]|uniref:Uncharacterized protein n=1 Tax=Purpureocillium lilacinum TaxID=33203 RepID=A0ACC4DEQ1_PURLI
MYYNHGDRNVAARWESETQSSSYASTCWGGYEGLPVMGLDYGHEVVPKREDSAAEDDDDDRRPLSPLPRLRSRPVGEAAMHTWLDGVEPGRAEACIPARRPWDGWDESDGDDCWPGWGRVYDADGEGGLDDDGWCGSEDSSGEGEPRAPPTTGWRAR